MSSNFSKFLKSIEISSFSATPKYQQLESAIIEGIRNGYLVKDDMLPSINDLSTFVDISRDTVEKAYKLLKKNEIIYSYPGKGYYISKSEVNSRLKIAVLLNKLSAHKKIVYDSFAKELHTDASMDLFVYNSDLLYLKDLLKNLTKTYDYYVLFPHFKEGRDKAVEIISKIPTEKLLMLGRFIGDVPGNFPAVYENYEKDIYEALEKAIDNLSKYKMLKLIFPDNSDYPKDIIKGFYKFCQQYAFDHQLEGCVEKIKVHKGECYINLAEGDLVGILDKILIKKLKIGNEVGVISYNETPLKKFILNGITTVSTDFDLMGKMAAKLIKEKSFERLEVPFNINIRPSI